MYVSISIYTEVRSGQIFKLNLRRMHIFCYAIVNSMMIGEEKEGYNIFNYYYYILFSTNGLISKLTYIKLHELIDGPVVINMKYNLFGNDHCSYNLIHWKTYSPVFYN
jgi:hypothetical protein